MRRVIRKGIDKSTGHCFTPRPCITGSNNVFVNNISVTRNGDFYPKHCCGKICHTGNAVSRSNVFVNGRSIHISGDRISCGDTAFHGSPNVFVN